MLAHSIPLTRHYSPFDTRRQHIYKMNPIPLSHLKEWLPDKIPAVSTYFPSLDPSSFLVVNCDRDVLLLTVSIALEHMLPTPFNRRAINGNCVRFDIGRVTLDVSISRNPNTDWILTITMQDGADNETLLATRNSVFKAIKSKAMEWNPSITLPYYYAQAPTIKSPFRKDLPPHGELDEVSVYEFPNFRDTFYPFELSDVLGRIKSLVDITNSINAWYDGNEITLALSGGIFTFGQMGRTVRCRISLANKVNGATSFRLVSCEIKWDFNRLVDLLESAMSSVPRDDLTVRNTFANHSHSQEPSFLGKEASRQRGSPDAETESRNVETLSAGRKRTVRFLLEQGDDPLVRSTHESMSLLLYLHDTYKESFAFTGIFSWKGKRWSNAYKAPSRCF